MALAIGLLFVAVTQLPSAAVDVYPEFGPPSVEIQTEALGLSAAEVEQLITVPIEQDLLNGVPWLDRLHSMSMPGLSVIDMTFQFGTNLYAARQMVEERMTQAHALPNVGSPPIMIQPLSSVSRVAMIRLSSKQVSLIDMSVLARWKIRPRLMGVPGVANVAIYGQRDRQLQVLVDPKRLGAAGVSLTQVIETAGNALWVSPLTFVEASTPGTGGFIESPNQRLSIQHISPISAPWQLATVPVQDRGSGGPLRLGDVAGVIVDHQTLIGDAVASGAPSLYLVVEESPGANTLAVTRGVEQALAAMAPGMRGITVDSHVYRPATYFETALRNIGLAGLIGFGLLIILLTVVLASWRAALIAVCAIAVSLAAAALVLYLRGATFTTMTLLGLAVALAVVVDDVITDIDAARRGLAAPEAADAAGDRAPAATLTAAFAAVRGPLALATLAILVAALPFLGAGQLTTAFTRPLVFTFALAVLASMLVAVTLTPALAAVLLRGHTGPRRWFARLVRRGAERALAAFLQGPGRAWRAMAALGVLAVLMVLGVAVPGLGGHPVLPVPQDRDLLLRLETMPGTSLREMDRITASVAGELRSIAGVTDVGAHVGRAVGSDQLVGVNTAEIWLTLDSNADYGRTVSAIEAMTHDFAGVKASLLSYPAAQLAQASSDASAGLVVRVYGADFATLRAKAGDVRAMLEHVPGVADPAVSQIPMQPTVDVEVNLAAAQRYGLLPGDIRREVTTLTSGLIVGSLYEQSKIYDVVVWGTPQTRSDLVALGNLLIDTPSGGQVALSRVATVAIRPEPAAIPHDGVMRYAEVTARITGDPGAVTAAVRSRIASMRMPYEYHAEVSGTAVSQRAILIRVIGWTAAALAGILLLLQAAAGSWRRAGLLLLSLPLSLSGAVLASGLAGGVVNAGSLAGLFAVLALAIRGAALLSRALRVAERAPDADGSRAVINAGAQRAVPLLQSVLAIAVVLLPAAVAGPGAGLELLHPLAVTTLGGLVSLLVVQGLVLPALLAAKPGHDAGPGPAPASPAPASPAPASPATAPAGQA